MEATLLEALVLLAGLSAGAAAEPASPRLSTQGSDHPAFTEMLADSGVDYVNVSGEPAKRFIVSSLGSGVGLIDFDEDGDLDLYFVNGARLIDDEPQSGEPNQLYRNDGDWKFTKISEHARVADTGWGFGVAVGDFDNDGFSDLYVTNIGPNRLYRNRGDGTFDDVSESMGVADASWSTSSVFFDADSDGDLDLYVANYADPDVSRLPEPGSRPSCQWFGLAVFCGPGGLTPQADTYYRNDGERFVEATKESGLDAPLSAYGLGVVVGDYDNDGDVDIYVANDSVPNFLFRNLGSGEFEEYGLIAGVAYNVDGLAQAGMGVDMGDIDSDQRLDIFVTNFSHDTNTAYRNTDSGFFSDATSESKLRMPSWFYLGWGTGFVDLDNDEDLDLFVANGHVYPEADDESVDTSYRQKNQIFWNLGSGEFEQATPASESDVMAQQESSRGAAFGDIDDDGDTDFVVTQIDDVPTLARNDGRRPGTLIRLVGRRSNRSAFGARLSWVGAEGRHMREVHAAGSFLSSRDARIVLPDSKATEIELRWPSGAVQRLPVSGAPPQSWVVVEPR